MLRFSSVAMYNEHMATAALSLFPYLTGTSASASQAPIQNLDEEQWPVPETRVDRFEHQPIQRNNDHVELREAFVRYLDPVSNVQHQARASARHPATNASRPSIFQIITPPIKPCGPVFTCGTYESAEVLLEPLTDAGRTRYWPQQPEEDRMPLDIEKFRNAGNSEAWFSRRRPAADEEEKDEARLLGVHSNNDAEAIPITKPTSRSMPAHAHIPSGGPRPRNTLNYSCSSRPFVSAFSRDTKQLDLETSRGSNVGTKPYVDPYDREVLLGSSPKRQKIGHRPSSSESARSDDKILEALGPDNVTFGPPSNKKENSRAVSSQSFNSQPSVVQGHRKESIGSLGAHRKLENMMRSEPATKKQQKGLNSGKNWRYDEFQSSPLMSSPSNPIDISGVDDEESLILNPTDGHGSTKQGGAGELQSDVKSANPIPAKVVRAPSTSERSEFFDTLHHPPSNGTRIQHRFQTQNGTDTKKVSTRLNDQFKPVNGDRRMSGVSMSSDIDELQSVGTTVGNNPDTLPSISGNRSRNNSPSKEPFPVLQDPSPVADESEIPRSNIRQEKFSSPKPRAQSGKLTVSRLSEKKASWSVELAAATSSGFLLNHDGVALVLDDRSRIYHVATNGGYTSIKIDPQKVQKITWGGRKVRFMSSQSGIDDHTVDLEFRTEKDVCLLIKNKCFEHVTRKEPRPSDNMDKIFEKKRSECRKIGNRLSTSLMHRQNVESNGNSSYRQTFDDKSRSRIAGDTNRQRPTKVVDDLWGRVGLPDPESTEKPDPKSRRNGTVREKSISEVLAELNPPPGIQLKRSTRASAQFKKLPQEPYIDQEDLPAMERYSKIYGLGDPWKKPLTYPKIGKKKTTVDFEDLERLDEGELLNDNLISFSLRSLEHTLEEQRPDLAKRVYFFNSFFFATLMDTHKGRARFNYDGVKKWTRNVDLFTYDYIVIPINDALHWYVAIICNLPALDRGLDVSDKEGDSPVEPIAGTARRVEQSDPPSSSPTINLPEGDLVTLVEEPKEPDEKGARNSFAELSLDIHATQPAAQDGIEDPQAHGTNLAEEDQEMLDGHLQRIKSRSPSQKPISKVAEQPDGESIKDLDPLLKPAAAYRKGKRKSMPAVTKLDPSKPVIITFDSLGLARSSTIRILKDYLREEAKAKRGGMEFEAAQIKGITASLIPLQENWYDCGIFLLGYVNKLLEDDPKDFIAKVIRREYDVQKDWPNLKPSETRKKIRDQLLKLHDEQEAERHRERSAQRSGKQQGPNPMSVLSRAASPARTIQQEALHDNESRHNIAVNSKESLTPTQPTTRDEAVKSAHTLPPNDAESDAKSIKPDHDHSMINDALKREVERQPTRERQPKSRSRTSDTPEKDKIEEEMPRMSADEPSVVVIASQSQQEEVPRSFHQSHPSQSKAITRRSEPSELPAEIPDSQPQEPQPQPQPQPQEPEQSETSKFIADIHRRHDSATKSSPAKKREIQEIQAVLVKNPKEHKRRKIDHEDRETGERRAEGKVHSSKTKLRDLDIPDWAQKHPSRRKTERKAGKAEEVINID